MQIKRMLYEYSCEWCKLRLDTRNKNHCPNCGLNGGVIQLEPTYLKKVKRGKKLKARIVSQSESKKLLSK